MNRSRTGLAALSLLLIFGCGDSTGPSVGSITVNAPQPAVAIGATLQLSATVLNSTGGTVSNPRIDWSSSDMGVATVTTAGLVTGVSGGTVRITAMSGGVSGNVDLTVLPPACAPETTAGSIAAGQTRTGTLTANSCLLPNGLSATGWLLTLASESTLRLSLTSADFDAVIIVTNMQFVPLTGNDDGGTGTDALVYARLPAGSYVVWASTFPGETGTYQLSASTATTGSCTTPVGTIAPSQTVNGTLAETDCLLDHGSFADLWQFTTASQVTVQIDLSSTVFDTYLYVANSSGTFIAEDDDSGGNFNSRITRTFAPGTYTFWASSFESTALGAYQLSVAAAGSPGAGGAEPHDAPSKKATPLWGLDGTWSDGTGASPVRPSR